MAMHDAHAVARLVDTPVYRCAAPQVKPARISYTPEVVFGIPVVNLDFGVVPKSLSSWDEIEPYKIDFEVLLAPDARASVKDISAKIYAQPDEGELPGILRSPDVVIVHEDYMIERTIIWNGEREKELDTILRDPGAASILDGSLRGEERSAVHPVIEAPGRIVCSDRCYGWLRVRYPRRAAKVSMTLPLFTAYLAYSTGEPGRVDQRRLFGNVWEYPARHVKLNPFCSVKALLAMTALGMMRMKSLLWVKKGKQSIRLAEERDYVSAAGYDWRNNPLIDPISFSLLILSSSGDALASARHSVILPAADVEVNVILVVNENGKRERLSETESPSSGNASGRWKETARGVSTKTIRARLPDLQQYLPIELEVERSLWIEMSNEDDNSVISRIDFKEEA